MTHPMINLEEKEEAFLQRMEAVVSEGGEGNVIVDADDFQLLIKLVRHWRRLDSEAANHVESVICMRSHHFTGMPPYVGWKGLGLALSQDYDDLKRLRAKEGE